MNETCPTISQWDLFLADRLPPEDEANLTAHLQCCPQCQSLLDQCTNPASIPQVRNLLETSPDRAHFTDHLEAQVLPSILAACNSAEKPGQGLPSIPGYELLDWIGEGGSSIVYRARDSKLQRTVAIKILRTAATSVQRQRFEKEARALASLRHLNIAGIIEVGEADSHPYLVLEYISGGSLARYLNGHSQPPLECARLVQQLAGAVQKAHDTGIIHRDLKPGNILLDPHFGSSETSGLDRFIPKLIDFGIAKDLESTEDFTHTRDFLGTPSYMAPEQVTRTRAAIDHRTDVYALGIILYEMLTGRPPFRAVSPIDTMLQIKHEDPVAPSRFEPKLPYDLENICLKCFEKDPARRYQSAQLLADDLDRFLQNKPVLARPLPQTARLYRWSRRNPGWAIASLFVFLILVTLAIVGPLLAAHEHQLREQAAQSAELAAFERNRARDHLDLAGNALEELLDKLLFNTRLQDSVFEEMQKGLVSFAMPYLEQFVQQEDSSANLRLRQARGLLQLAIVQAKTGNMDKAQATYESALRQLADLQSLETLGQELRWRALSAAHMEYGRFLTIHQQKDRQAEEHFRKSLFLLEKLSQGSDREKYLDSFAIIYSLLGSVISSVPQRREEGRSYAEKAVEVREKLVELHPTRDDLRHYAAMARMNLAIYYKDNGPVEQEVEQFRLALEHELKVNHSKSVWIESPYHVTLLEGELGVALQRAKRKDESMPHLKAAVRTAEALTVVYPAVEKYSALHKRALIMLKHYDK